MPQTPTEDTLRQANGIAKTPFVMPWLRVVTDGPFCPLVVRADAFVVIPANLTWVMPESGRSSSG